MLCIVGYNKIVHATETLVQYLEATGMITLGDRSTPEEIAKVFPMMSKGEFKGAVGALLRFELELTDKMKTNTRECSNLSFAIILHVIVFMLHPIMATGRTGAITISEKEIYLVPEDQRVPAPVLPYSGKAPRGWTAPDGCIIFAGKMALVRRNK